jgi:hypothetical protein
VSSLAAIVKWIDSNISPSQIKTLLLDDSGNDRSTFITALDPVQNEYPVVNYTRTIARAIQRTTSNADDVLDKVENEPTDMFSPDLTGLIMGRVCGGAGKLDVLTCPGNQVTVSDIDFASEQYKYPNPTGSGALVWDAPFGAPHFSIALVPDAHRSLTIECLGCSMAPGLPIGVADSKQMGQAHVNYTDDDLDVLVNSVTGTGALLFESCQITRRNSTNHPDMLMVEFSILGITLWGFEIIEDAAVPGGFRLQYGECSLGVTRMYLPIDVEDCGPNNEICDDLEEWCWGGNENP